MVLYTYYTSFLFILTSFVAPTTHMARSLALLSCTSILHHGKFFQQYPGKRTIIFIDRLLAHYITIVSFIWSLNVCWRMGYNYMYLLGYYFCLIYVVLTYYTYLKYQLDLTVHGTMHIASCIGLYLLFQTTPKLDKI